MDFKTIKQKVQVEIVEQKSKFITHLMPVDSVEEAEKIIREMKKQYHDARHNCFAYRIIDNSQVLEKSSDDGEPSGTAGAPMLSILKKNDLANIMVIVTRYFGGILLGTGGLVRAYSESLLKAIQVCDKIEKCEGIEMLITVEYSEFEPFKYYCKNHNIFITNVEFSEYVVCKIELEEEKKQQLLEDFETKMVILKQIRQENKKNIIKSI